MNSTSECEAPVEYTLVGNDHVGALPAGPIRVMCYGSALMTKLGSDWTNLLFGLTMDNSRLNDQFYLDCLRLTSSGEVRYVMIPESQVSGDPESRWQLQIPTSRAGNDDTKLTIFEFPAPPTIADEPISKTYRARSTYRNSGLIHLCEFDRTGEPTKASFYRDDSGETGVLLERVAWNCCKIDEEGINGEEMRIDGREVTDGLLYVGLLNQDGTSTRDPLSVSADTHTTKVIVEFYLGARP